MGGSADSRRPGRGAKAAQQAQALFSEALDALRAGRTAEGEQGLRQVLAADPRHGDALQVLGVLAAQAGRFDQAADCFRRASGARPGDPTARYNLGNALKDSGRLEEAVTAYRNAVVLKPDYAEAHNNLGVVLQELGRDAEAVQVYERARALHPAYVEAHFNLGNALKAQGRHEPAVEAYAQALALRPDYAQAHNNQGVALKMAGRLEEAVTAFGRAVAIQPDYADAYSNLGVALQVLGRSQAAVDAYARAIDLNPTSAEAHNNLGVALKGLGRFDEADAAYARALDLRPDYAEAHINMAVSAEEHGRPEAARASADRALALDPGSGHAWYVRSNLKTFAPGDPDLAAMQALLAPGQVERLNVDDHARLEYALAKACIDQGDADRTFAHLDAGARIKRAGLSYDGPTAARWMAQIAGTFTPDLLARLAGAGDPSDLPIFVLGMPRSGTSLVEQILASHPKVHGAGELNLVEHLVRGPPPEGLGMAYPRDAPGLTREVVGQLGRDYVARLSELAQGHARVVDKLPGNFHFAGLIWLMAPNARIIHCRRDPVDTCFSCYSKLFTDGQPFTYDLAELGHYYRAYDALMDHWRAVLPGDRFIEIQYEALVDDLEGETRRLLAACGLDWDEACARFHETRRPVRTASTAQVRRPLYRSSLGRWRAFEAHLGPLLSALGVEEQR